MKKYNREMTIAEFEKLCTKDERYNYRTWPTDYRDLINSFACVVVCESHDGGYQGDSRYLFRNTQDKRYGYLCYGWGSCSGCDSFEACYSNSDFLELRNNLWNWIVWKDSKADMLEWFKTHDWQGDYDYDESFVADAIKKLSRR